MQRNSISYYIIAAKIVLSEFFFFHNFLNSWNYYTILNWTKSIIVLEQKKTPPFPERWFHITWAFLAALGVSFCCLVAKTTNKFWNKAHHCATENAGLTLKDDPVL